MARQMTFKEQDIVRQNAKKKDEDLPTFFNDSLDTDQQITREFESWIILLNKGDRNKIVEALKDT